MRPVRACLLPLLLCLCACSEPAQQPSAQSAEAKPSEPVVEPTPMPSASAAAAEASASADAGTPPSSTAESKPRPERPVPKNVRLVSMKMPEEVQMKAIAYMAAMRAPQPNDPAPNVEFLQSSTAKLANTSRALDRGKDKASWNRTELVHQNRQIDLLMSEGCNAETPKRLAVQIAPLSTWYAQGLLVLRCNDKKLQCLQSTQDPADVLCTSAPRRTP